MNLTVNNEQPLLLKAVKKKSLFLSLLDEFCTKQMDPNI